MIHRSRPKRRAPQVPWLPWHDELIGLMTDLEVADATGHSPYAVQRRRYVIGASAFSPRFEVAR